MRVDDSQPFLYMGLGDSLNRAGRFEDAEKAFRTVIGLDPDAFDAYYNLGVTFLARERLGDAAREFERALALGPGHVHAAAYNNGVLIGRLVDQAALAGVLNALYELHMPVLSVDFLEDGTP